MRTGRRKIGITNGMRTEFFVLSMLRLHKVNFSLAHKMCIQQKRVRIAYFVCMSTRKNSYILGNMADNG